MSETLVSGRDLKQKRDGRMVLAWIFGFFATFMVVDAYMVTVAVTTQTGTVMDHPYETGLAYNRVIDAAKRQHELGWRGDISVVEQSVIFRLNDAGGRAISGAKGNVTFFRPVQAGDDFTVPLVENPQGIYRAAISKKIIGRWQVRVHVTKGDSQFDDHRDVNL